MHCTIRPLVWQCEFPFKFCELWISRGDYASIKAFSVSQHGWNGQIVCQSIFEEGNGYTRSSTGNLWLWWWLQTKRCRNAVQPTNLNRQTGIWKRYPNDHGQQMWGFMRHTLSYIPRCIRQDNILDWIKYRNMLNDNKIVGLFIFLKDEFEPTLTKSTLPYCVKRQSDEIQSNLAEIEIAFAEIAMNFLWD